jgi:TRAP-type C4-dicarboxylate transport system substrate-binding protein
MKNLLISAAALGIAAVTSSNVSAETTLKAVAFIPKSAPVMAMSREWVKEINAGLKGKLKIDYVGGPEVLPRYQQMDAVGKGIMDISFSVTSDIQDRLPIVNVFNVSKCTPTQERKTGFYKDMAAAFAKLNLKYIGRVQRGAFYLWVDKDPKNLADLKGLKMRTGSLYDQMMKKLGMVPVTMNSPEVYTALERGVVDGFGWPVIGPRKRGWLKKVKYVIDLPFFSASDMVILMNMNKWKSLPAAVRKKVMAITIKFEPKMVSYFKKQEADEWKKINKLVTRVKFSPAENKEYLNAAYGTMWHEIAQKIGQKPIAKLKKETCN